MEKMLEIVLSHWQLVVSSLFFAAIVPIILFRELKRVHQEKTDKTEQVESLLPVIEKVQKEHESKFGSPSKELDNEYKHLTRVS